MKAIVAMDPSQVIGYKGEIPWHIPEDMRWFKWVTRGLPYKRAIELSQFPLATPDAYENGAMWGLVVMGNTTYQKVGNLPNRVNFVLTNDPVKLAIDPTPQMTYVTYQGVLNLQASPYIWNHTWVIGGGKTYQLFLPHCTDVFVTHVLEDYEGDAYMPEFEDKFPNQELLAETKNYWMVRYWRDEPKTI